MSQQCCVCVEKSKSQKKKMLQFILLACCTFLVNSGHAPDVSPQLPDGWCNIKYGTPTRSTGECICKKACKGNGCRREQGIIWYEYNKCPSCECIPLNDDTLKLSPIEIVKPTPVPVFQEDSAEIQDEFHLQDWIEDNSRNIFAIIVSLFVFSLAIVAIFSIQSTGNK
jgi:hypothetical protein